MCFFDKRKKRKNKYGLENLDKKQSVIVYNVYNEDAYKLRLRIYQSCYRLGYRVSIYIRGNELSVIYRSKRDKNEI